MQENAADNDFDQELIIEYREGFNDHYEEIINCIATLEADPKDGECIDELFRAFHTVKGDARMLMFDQLADFLHSVEDSISALREQTIVYTDLLGESITLSLDKAREISEAIFAQSMDDDPSIEIIRNLFKQIHTGLQEEVDPVCAKIIKEITGFDIDLTSSNIGSVSVVTEAMAEPELKSKSEAETKPAPKASSAAQPETVIPDYTTDMVQEMSLYIGKDTPEHLKGHLSYMRYLALMLETKIPHWNGRVYLVKDLLSRLNKALDYPVAKHQLEMAGYTHDMAFSFLPNSLMLKQEKFTAEELMLMQSHTQIAADYIGMNNEWREAHQIVLQHHERCDGNGYPKQLQDDQICNGAKMMSIVDAFIAMTTPRPDRPYKRSVLVALNEIKAKAGTQFSAEYAAEFISLLVNQLK